MPKPSNFNIKIKFGKKWIIYNTFSGAVILTKNDNLKDSQEEALLKNNILAQEEVDEIEQLRERFYKNKDNFQEMEFTIIPTYSCNLACKYCYEGDKNIDFMDDEISKKSISFIKNLISKRKPRRVNLRFYGGEPMLAIRTTEIFLKQIFNFCKNKKIFFSASLISNGTLFTKKNLEILKRYNVTLAVTVNGPREIHDKNRPFINGGGTFDTIIANLKIVRDLQIQAYICINVDKKTFSKIKNLLRYLKKEGLNKFPLNFGVILPIKEACNYPFPASTKLLPKLWDLGLREGFKIAIGSGLPRRFAYCKQLTKSGYTIGPRGEIYSCIALSDKEHFEGKIDSSGNVKLNENYFKWHSRNPFKNKKCLKCKILPICCGGCPILSDDEHLNKECYLNEKLIASRVKLFLKQKDPLKFKGIRVV